MPGRRIALFWTYNPTLYAPPRYRKACRYEAYIPVPLAELPFSLGAAASGAVSDAEQAIQRLNASAQPALAPLVQAALVHAQFETIHPFEDGNGRTGRALVQVVLRRRGLAPDYVPPISIVLANARDRYIAGLTAFREEGVGAWVEHFAAAAAAAATLARAYLHSVRVLDADWRTRLKTAVAPRSDAAAWAVIGVLPAHPIVTAPVAAAATRRSKPSIYEAIRQLQEAGVLLPLSSSPRNRSWEAAGLLDLLADLEAGQAP